MKAIVNIGFRCVELIYSINQKDLFYMTQEDKNKHFKDWGGYIFQGYEYKDGQPQNYDDNIVKQVSVIF